MQSTTLSPDIDFEIDIEEELTSGDHDHAFLFCYEHSDPKYIPVSGTIVQVLCGRIFRMSGSTEDKELCEECLVIAHDPSPKKCYVCGKSV